MPELTENPFTRTDSVLLPPQAEEKTELQMLDEDIARRKRARAPESKPPFLQRLATSPVGDIFAELLEGTAPFAEVPAGLAAGSIAATVRPFAAAGLLPGVGGPGQARESIVSDLTQGVDPRPKARARARQFDEDVDPLLPKPQGRISQKIFEAVDKPFAAIKNDLVRAGMNPEDAQLLIEAGFLAAPAAVRGGKAAFRGARALGERGSTFGPVKPKPPAEKLGGTTPEEITVSLKKADVTAELAELGIKAERADRVSFEATLDQAKEVIKNDPTAPARLAAEALESARALNPVEKATLLTERVRLSNLREQMDGLLETAQKGRDQLAIDTAKANVESVRGEYQAVSEAALLQGRESGLSLAFQKMLLKRDFSLANLERQRRTIKGKALNPKELQETKALHEGIEKSQRKLDEKVKGLKEEQEASQGSIEEIFKEPAEEVTVLRDDQTGRGSAGEGKTVSLENIKRDKEVVTYKLKKPEDVAPGGVKAEILAKGSEDVRPGAREAIITVNNRTGKVEIKGAGEKIGRTAKEIQETFKDSIVQAVNDAKLNRESVRKGRTELGLDPETGVPKKSKPASEPKPRKKATDEQLTKRAVASLERSIEELQTRIKEKDLSTKRNPFTTPATPEVQALRARRQALRSELNELRKLQKDKKSPRQIALQRLKTRLKNETARLQKRLELKDFAEKEKIPLELDKEASQLLVENEKAKEAFNEALFKDKLANQSLSKQVISGVAETLNISRAVITSLDLSAVARQGGFIGFGNPIRAAKSFPAMIKALRSEAGQASVMAEIKGRKNFPLMRQSKLFFAERDKGLIGQEEVYMSRHVDKIPLVAASQRAYVTFLNKLRADSFDAMVKSLGKEGVVTLNEAKAIANYVNVATGRGSVTASTTALVNMNTVFFAPRLVLSRFQLLTGQPLRAASSPRVRALIVKEYGKFLAGIGTMYALGQLAGADIEVDPRSSDFGKIRFGNTRIDVLTGISQASTFLARLASGQIKGLKSGKVSKLTGPEARKFGNKDLFDVLATFFRTKLSPAVGTAIDVKVGTDVVGNQVTLESATANLLTPLVIQDIFEAMKEQGVPATIALSLLAILGFGMQTFNVNKRRREDRRGFFSIDRLKQKVGLGPKVAPASEKAPVESNLQPNPFNRRSTK